MAASSLLPSPVHKYQEHTGECTCCLLLRSTGSRTALGLNIPGTAAFAATLVRTSALSCCLLFCCSGAAEGTSVAPGSRTACCLRGRHPTTVAALAGSNPTGAALHRVEHEACCGRPVARITTILWTRSNGLSICFDCCVGYRQVGSWRCCAVN
jgi:hypothetical protein